MTTFIPNEIEKKLTAMCEKHHAAQFEMLAGRLEKVFLAHREKLAAVRQVNGQISEVKDRFQRDYEAIRKAMNAKSEALIDEAKLFEKRSTELISEIAKMKAQVGTTERLIESELELNASKEETLREKRKRVSEETLQQQQIHMEVQFLIKEKKEIEENIKEMEKEINSKTLRMEEIELSTEKFNQEAVVFENLLKEEKKQFDEEYSKKHDIFMKISSNSEGLEQKLREEFVIVLQDIICQRQKSFDEEKDLLCEGVREQSECIIEEQINRSRDLFEEIQTLETNIQSLDSDYILLNAKLNENTKINAILLEQADQLEETMNILKRGPIDKIGHLEKLLEKCERRFMEVSTDFDELHHSNSEINQQLIKYKSLLEQEEERLNLNPRKQRRIYPEPSFSFPSSDLTISNDSSSITILNCSSLPKSLNGHSVIIREKDLCYSFKDIVLEVGESMKLLVTSDSKCSKWNEIQWIVKDYDTFDGTISLTNSNGEVLDECTTHSLNNAKSTCAIQ